MYFIRYFSTKAKVCLQRSVNPSAFQVIISYIRCSDVTVTDKKTFSMSSTHFKVNKKDVFKGVLDRFDGVTVKSQNESCDVRQLVKKLEDSILLWKDTNKRGIWFNVHIEQADWIPVLVKNGFKFHHAKENYVMMYLWLPTEEINIPVYAHTMLGVGAVVINDKNQILVVSEKHYDIPTWKLPGGYVEPHENLVDSAIREVEEETNIKTEFQSIISLRHNHHGMFGCSDIYTVISLKPITFDIQKGEREIVDSKWMNVDEYLGHPQVRDFNKVFVQKYFEYRKSGIKIDCQHGIHPILKKPYTVYHITKDNDEEVTKCD